MYNINKNNYIYNNVIFYIYKNIKLLKIIDNKYNIKKIHNTSNITNNITKHINNNYENNIIKRINTTTKNINYNNEYNFIMI